MKLMLLSSVRENSSRLPNKLIRPFGDTTLADILIDRFEEIQDTHNPFDKITVSVNKNDKVLWDKLSKSSLDIIERNDKSISKGNLKISDVHNYLKDETEIDYVMWINASFPFLKTSTIIQAANLFKYAGNIKSMTCVKRRYNWFWDVVDRKPINNLDYRNVNTQYTPPLLESVHCFHIFDREFMLNNNCLWKYKNNDPYLYELEDSTEFLDIDNELDFKVCESIYDSNC